MKQSKISNQLYNLVGNIDIYLLDQLLKGTYNECETVMDAGCGGGRNLFYFLNAGFLVYGLDPDPERIAQTIELSKQLSPLSSPDNFKKAKVEDLPFGDAEFDVVISSAVLHFAENQAHFDQMLKATWQMVKPGGYFFARLASDIGIESLIKPLGNRRYLLPDGSERFLVNEQMLFDYTRELNGDQHEFIKTTNVQNLRCMTTWCMRKPFASKALF